MIRSVLWTQEWIRADQKHLGTGLDDHSKGRLEIAIARGGDHNEFLPCRPCTLPPGWLRVATRPAWTGSKAATKTMGIDVRARFAAKAAGGPDAAIRRTCPLTRSAANAGSRSSWPSAMRASTVTSRPTV